MFGDNPLRLSKVQNPDIVRTKPGENGMTALKALGRLLWSPVRASENWAQTLVRVAGNFLRWVIGLPIVVGLLGWGVFSFNSWWKDRPYRLTGLEGVEIGMTPTEVTLIKGAPSSNDPAAIEDSSWSQLMFFNDLLVILRGESQDQLRVSRVCLTEPRPDSRNE